MPRKKTEDKYNYILDYIKESVDARASLRDVSIRSTNAYKGNPFVNYYRRTLENYKSTIDKNQKKLEEFSKFCGTLQDKTNMTVFNAIETLVSMAMGGAGQFEFLPYDKYQEADSELIDRMTSAAEYFFDTNNVDAILPQAVRQMGLQGSAYLHIKPIENKGANFKLSLIDSYRMLTDPYRNRTNRARYIGFTQAESWSVIKDNIDKTKQGYVVSAMNAVDLYLEQVKSAINSSDYQADQTILDDLNTFYSPYVQMAKSDTAKDPKDKYQYRGDDIEISYIYDLEANMYFEVINRRYIVVAKDNPLSTKISIPYKDSKGEDKTFKKTVSVAAPIVEIPYIKTSWETYPISPLFYVLDDFDSVCSIESVLYHNLSIMAPINFVGSSYDTEIISRAIQIPGEMIDGVMGQTGVFSKSHDTSAVIGAITRYEERIKRALGATDQFELQAMIGNRATASEVSSANGAVSQRLNQILANIETGMSDLADIFFKMYVIFSDEDEISFAYKGRYDEISKTELATDCIVRGRLKSAIKLEQAEQSRNSLQLIGFLGQNEAIDKKPFFGTMIPLAVQNLVSRQQAESFVNEEYRIKPTDVIDSDMTEKINSQIGSSGIDGMNVDDLAPEELDAVMSMVQQASVGQDPMAMAQGQPPVDSGIPTVAPGTLPDAAGLAANTVGGY